MTTIEELKEQIKILRKEERAAARKIKREKKLAAIGLTEEEMLKAKRDKKNAARRKAYRLKKGGEVRKYRR